MNTLDYIINKYHLDPNLKSPIDIPDIGREHLAGLFRELKFKVGVEIGTERGLYAEILCKSNPALKLYCIDPWISYKGYRDFEKTMDKNYKEAQKRLSKYNCNIIRKFSLDAVNEFKDESLDFVYIDGNHNFQNVVNDLFEWSRKVKIGGIVSGHDFIHKKRHRNGIALPNINHQVIEAVRGYVNAYDINPWFLLGSKWPKPGEFRDPHRSYLWVRNIYV